MIYLFREGKGGIYRLYPQPFILIPVTHLHLYLPVQSIPENNGQDQKSIRQKQELYLNRKW